MLEVFQRVDTLFIPVSNMSSSIDWYQTVFGCKLIWNENDEYAALNVSSGLPEGASANIKLGHCMITLVKSEAFVPLLFKKNGEDHPYFNFYSKEIDNTYRHLATHGVTLTKIKDEGHLKHFNFYDLNGHYLGVCCF